MCLRCPQQGHDPEDHELIHGPDMDPKVRESVNQQIEYARETLNELFHQYIEELFPTIQTIDYQSGNLIGGFFKWMYDNEEKQKPV